MAAPRPATTPAARIRPPLSRAPSSPALLKFQRMDLPKQKGGRSLCRPGSMRSKTLLQVGHRRQVGRELGDAGCAAPVRTCPQRIVPGNGGGSNGRIESTREYAAITLRQVGVRVAQVQREHLVGKADADVPGVVIGIVN